MLIRPLFRKIKLIGNQPGFQGLSTCPTRGMEEEKLRLISNHQAEICSLLKVKEICLFILVFPLSYQVGTSSFMFACKRKTRG